MSVGLSAGAVTASECARIRVRCEPGQLQVQSKCPGPGSLLLRDRRRPALAVATERRHWHGSFDRGARRGGGARLGTRRPDSADGRRLALHTGSPRRPGQPRALAGHDPTPPARSRQLRLALPVAVRLGVEPRREASPDRMPLAAGPGCVDSGRIGSWEIRDSENLIPPSLILMSLQEVLLPWVPIGAWPPDIRDP